MKRILWLPLVLVLLAFSCAKLGDEIKKEKIAPPVTPSEERQEILPEPEPEPETGPILVRREIVPLPQITPLPLGRGESLKPEESIPKRLPLAIEGRRTKAEAKEASVTHLVKKGESLWKIAERHYQDGYLYKRIAQVNHIQSPYTIYPGQNLIIPRLHSVKKGESLWKIAEKYYHHGHLFSAIAQANHLRSPYTIYPDDELIIPTGGMAVDVGKAKKAQLMNSAWVNKSETKQAANPLGHSKVAVSRLPKLWQEIGGRPYQGTWQEAIDKLELPGSVKEEVKKNIRQDKFQWLETGLTGGQKLSQLVFGNRKIWNNVICYWDFHQGYPAKDYGTVEYRVIQISECGNWAWWREEPRAPPKELSGLEEKLATMSKELSGLDKKLATLEDMEKKELVKLEELAMNLAALKEVLTEKEEVSWFKKPYLPWIIVAIFAAVLAAVSLWLSKTRTARKKPKRKGGKISSR